MNMHGSLRQNKALTLSTLAIAVMLGLPAAGASYEWTFNSGDLSTTLGSGSMAYADAQTAGITTFGTTGGGVPNIGGQAANFIHVPVMPNISNGYLLSFDNT